MYALRPRVTGLPFTVASVGTFPYVEAMTRVLPDLEGCGGDLSAIRITSSLFSMITFILVLFVVLFVSFNYLVEDCILRLELLGYKVG